MSCEHLRVCEYVKWNIRLNQLKIVAIVSHMALCTVIISVRNIIATDDICCFYYRYNERDYRWATILSAKQIWTNPRIIIITRTSVQMFAKSAVSKSCFSKLRNREKSTKIQIIQRWIKCRLYGFFFVICI